MQVALMAAAGIPKYAIAKMMNLHFDTLTKHYEHEFTNGIHQLTANIATRLYKKAMSNDSDARQAGEFLLKARAGWGEKKSLEIGRAHV